MGCQAGELCSKGPYFQDLYFRDALPPTGVKLRISVSTGRSFEFRQSI